MRKSAGRQIQEWRGGGIDSSVALSKTLQGIVIDSLYQSRRSVREFISKVPLELEDLRLEAVPHRCS